MRLLPRVMTPSGRRPAGLASGVRGPAAGRSRALGALVLGGAAAAALAGCAVVPAPAANGAAGQPAGTASSGTILTGARSAGSAPGPHQRAVADASAMLDAFVPPPGARKLPCAPSAAGGALGHASSTPVTPDLVDKAEWWVAPGAPRPVLAWEAAHLPHRFTYSGSGGTSGPHNTDQTWLDTFSLPDIYGVLDFRELIVQVAADGKKDTAIRVDAQVTWQPARPASEKVPAAARAVTISEDPGQIPGQKAPKPVTITARARVRGLVALINGLPLTQPGEFSCPAGWGDSLTLTFRPGPGRPAVAVAVAELSGCPEVDLTLGGQPQPVLAGLNAAQILSVAGLHWKIPVG